MNCHRHSNTPTSVSCGRCGENICSACMVSTSAGMRCSDCAYAKPLVAQTASQPASTGMAAFAGLLTGLAGAYIVAFATFVFPPLTLIVGPIYGRFVGDAILSFAGDARGKKIEAVGVGSVLLGSFVALGTPFGAGRMVATAATTNMSQAMVGLSLGIAVAVCYHRLKSKPA